MTVARGGVAGRPSPGLGFGFGPAFARRLGPPPVPAPPASNSPSRRRRVFPAFLAVSGLAGTALLVHGLWIPAKAVLAQVLLERAWRRAVAGEARPRPWPWADTWPVGRLRLPAPAGGEPSDLIVLAGASGRTLAFGPGHLDGSALPGEAGNAVVAGHRDTHFRALERVAPGDEIAVETAAAGGVRERRYRVVAAAVVDRSRTDLLAEAGELTLTLVTCWPFDAVAPGGPLRYVVVARASSG